MAHLRFRGLASYDAPKDNFVLFPFDVKAFRTFSERDEGEECCREGGDTVAISGKIQVYFFFIQVICRSIMLFL